jgi:hypothetical protein
MFFLIFLLYDRRILIRISDKWIRIRGAQKHKDPDPQHWFLVSSVSLSCFSSPKHDIFSQPPPRLVHISTDEPHPHRSAPLSFNRQQYQHHAATRHTAAAGGGGGDSAASSLSSGSSSAPPPSPGCTLSPPRSP